MKYSFFIVSICLFLFCFIHTYLWAYGIHVPVYEWFGFALYMGYALSVFIGFVGFCTWEDAR